VSSGMLDDYSSEGKVSLIEASRICSRYAMHLRGAAGGASCNWLRGVGGANFHGGLEHLDMAFTRNVRGNGTHNGD
jgi:hypothetical protein